RIAVPTLALKFGGPPEPCRNVDSTMIRFGFVRTARQAAASVGKRPLSSRRGAPFRMKRSSNAVRFHGAGFDMPATVNEPDVRATGATARTPWYAWRSPTGIGFAALESTRTA